jgi:hypothetical protein
MRTSVGVVWQFWKRLVVSAQGGAAYGNTFVRPYEDGNAENRVQVQAGSGYSYFAGVSVAIVIP